MSTLWGIVKRWWLSRTTKPSPKPVETKPVDIEPIPDNGSEPQVKPVDSDPYPGLLFPDISDYRKCDFTKFDGQDLIFKATDGTKLVHKTLKPNMEECFKRGIRQGVYHFYRVHPDPVDQADFFVKTVGVENLKNMYHLPIVDFESVSNPKAGRLQDNQMLKKDIADLKLFIKRVNELTGRKMRIYMGAYAFEYMKLDNEFLELCDEPWIAHYSKAPTFFAPWSKPWAHQRADDEHFNGIGPCDVNIFY